MPPARYGVTGMLDKRQPSCSTALVLRLGKGTMGEVEFDKEVTCRDDMIPLSSPHQMMTGGCSGDELRRQEDGDDFVDKLSQSDRRQVEPSVGQSVRMGMETMRGVEFDKGVTSRDDITPLSLPHLMITRDDDKDDTQRQGVIGDIMCKPSLYDKLQAEPSMGQSGNTDTGKDIQVHINTVVPTEPGVNVPVEIPSTPVQERSSIASADRGGQGGGEGAMTDTPPSRTKRVKCVYTKEGVCNYHGEGAKEHSKPIIEIYYEKGVKKRRVKEKIVQFVCDTDLSGKKKLKQPKISFIKKQISGEGGGDTTLETGKDLSNLGYSDMRTVGQISGPAMKKRTDEK